MLRPMIDYTHKTTPRAYQAEEFQQHGHDRGRGLWWEMGCGKSKPVIDSMASLYECHEIDGALIIAPGGVHGNWARDEIGRHMPDRVREHASVFRYDSAKAPNLGFQRELARVMASRFPVIAMTYAGAVTRAGEQLIKEFLRARDCMMVLDECTAIKTPGAARTKKILTYAKNAPYRRALTGTLVSNSPFDVYTQLRFVDAAAWHHLGIRNAASFRATFGVWEKGYGAGGREFPKLVEYRNLDALREVIHAHGSRLTKAEVLDLPPKIYQARRFEMSRDQRRIYGELAREMRALLADGAEVSMDIVLTQMVRMQQATCGYLPGDDDGNLRPIFEGDKNPRVEMLGEVLDEVGDAGKVIIWCERDQDVDSVMRELEQRGMEAVRYDGKTSEEDRMRARDDFQEGPARAFVSKPSVGGTGLTLTAATTVIYYSCGYRLDNRLQSEDRAHRIGQHRPVNYVDIVAEDSIDEGIMDALLRKADVAAVVQGDSFSGWFAA